VEKIRIVIFIVILLLFIAGGIWYIYFRDHEGELTASGTIEVTEITVSSKVIGRVVELRVDEGSDVSEGDIIAVIESNELEAVFKSAQAKYKIAKDDYERSKQLYSEKMVSPQQFEAAASAFEVASAALDTAKVQYENTVIKSPISGKVLVKAIEKGELATVGSSIVTLADLSEVNLTVYLAEKDIGKIMLGEEVLVSVDSFPDEKFKGKVVFISEKAEFTPKAIQTKDERITQVFGIKIKIPNPEMKLKPGMPADAEF
jgi:HlyD family secretion protein